MAQQSAFTRLAKKASTFTGRPACLAGQHPSTAAAGNTSWKAPLSGSGMHDGGCGGEASLEQIAKLCSRGR